MRHPFLRTLAGSAATPTDPNFENVTLLLHGDGTNGGQNNTFVDGSTNNFTITRNGNTTQGTFSPYGDLWSNYFDGTGDRLKFPDSADWDFGTGDFTIEFWFALNVVPTTSSTTRQSFVSHYKAATPSIGFNCQLGEAPDNKINFGWGDTALAVSAARTWSTNRWYHYAVARSGTSLKLFIDGEQVASVTDSTNMTGSSNSCTIGALNVATSGENFIQHVNGYVSNVRILKGTAIYTSAFTPPTAPLTAITNTVLLTCQSNRFKDNSSSNRTATRDGDVSVQRFSPFSPTAAYAAGTIGGSGYFDGTGDWVQAADNAAFTLGTSDFTIEAWVYTTTAGTLRIAGQSDSSGNNSTISAWIAKRSDETAVGVVCSGGTEYLVSTTTAIRLGQWNHVVMTRDGSTLRMYVNGVQGGTRSITGVTVNDSSRALAVGRLGDITSNTWNGYISDYRLVVGTCVYPSGTTFTPPTAPLTAITNTSLLLNFTNAAILDNAMMAVPETVGNAQIDTTTKKFGTGSLEFDGTGDYLTVPNNPAFSFGTGDFTIECWVYIAANSALDGLGNRTAGLFSAYAASGTVSRGYAFEIEGNASTTGTGLSFYNNNSGTQISVIATTTISQGTWHHVAVCRSGTTTRLFLNGSSVASGTLSNQNVNSDYPITIGRLGYASFLQEFNGYIDDLRITKGVARYTSNFTAPTAAFPDL